VVEVHRSDCTPIIVQYGTIPFVLDEIERQSMTATTPKPQTAAIQMSGAHVAAAVEAAYILDAVRR
jgi:hypothetical protein